VPATKGPGVDQSTVERVKALRATNVPQKTVAEQLGIHISTVRRYERRQDDTPEQEEARVRELVRCVESGYKIMHLGFERVVEGFEKKEIKAKDAAVITAIMADKIEMWVSRLAPQTKSTETITFKFVSDGPDNRPLPDAKEVPYLPESVQSDDMRPGSGQDVLRLPGGSQNSTGEPEVEWRNRSIDLPEPEGLRGPDDNGGAMGRPGDPERVE